MDLLDWAWARHHNEWSWYIRPLILIAFCLSAWHRRLIVTILIALFFPLSAVIFPAPDVPKDFVVAFLSAEREMLTSMTTLQFGVFVGLVIAFLGALAAAFWRRSLLWGLVVANLGGAIKLAFGLVVWGETGWTALVPTVATAAVFNAVCLYLLRRR